MLDRRVEVDVVRHLERQAQLDICAAGCAAPSCELRRARRHGLRPARRPGRDQRVQRGRAKCVAEAVSSTTSSPARQPTRLLAGPRKTPNRSQEAERLELARAARRTSSCRRAEEPHARTSATRSASALRSRQRNASASSANAPGSFSERLVLVAEDRGREQVEEAVLAAGRTRVVQPGRRLEHEPALAAAADEPGRAPPPTAPTPPQRTFARGRAPPAARGRRAARRRPPAPGPPGWPSRRLSFLDRLHTPIAARS